MFHCLRQKKTKNTKVSSVYPQRDGDKRSLNIKALKTLRNNILIEDRRIVEFSNPKLEVIVAKETNATDTKNSSC